MIGMLRRDTKRQECNLHVFARIASVLAVALMLGGCGRVMPQPIVNLSPGALDFGNTVIGTSAPPQEITLQNTGTAALAISSILTTGDYSVAHDCAPSVAPVSFCKLTITFTPTAVGARPGTLQIVDNAFGSPQSAALNATGVTMHDGLLSWDGSTSAVIGYFVYRSKKSGGPYVRLNDRPEAATTFQTKVPGGQDWYFRVTALDANLVESLPSNEATVAVPP